VAAGTLGKGAPADLCLFHPDRIWQVEAGNLPGKAQNTPFDGRALEGVVLGTWKAGRRVFGQGNRLNVAHVDCRIRASR
jgi:dihydroorotase